MKLTLALLVTGILADDADHTLAADDAAGFTEGLDGGTDSHGDGKRDKKRARFERGGWGAYWSATEISFRKPKL